jgi:hypothetical protein
VCAAGYGSTFYAWWVREREGSLCVSSYCMNLSNLWNRPTGRNPLASIPVMFDGRMQQMYLTPQEHPPAYEGAPDYVSSYLFLDWSVRKVGLKELWTLKWYMSFDTKGPWTKAGGVMPDQWPKWMQKFKDY